MSSTALARYRMNDYSVPTRLAFENVLVKGFVEEVVIVAGSEIIAGITRGSMAVTSSCSIPSTTWRCWSKSPVRWTKRHHCRTGACPSRSSASRRLLESRMGNRGKKEFIQILRLMEVFPETIVAIAVVEAMRLGAISFDAVKQLVLARIERRPARLDIARYPYLPAAEVRTTTAADYAALLSRSAA